MQPLHQTVTYERGGRAPLFLPPWLILWCIMITLMRLCWYKPRATNACPDSRRRLLMGGGQIGFTIFML